MRALHPERHRTTRTGWLRAVVLGANDGLVSVSSLVVGIAASGTGGAQVLLAGVAGLVAGALSMAAGEYVSVQSQADTEGADLLRERGELATDPEGELNELAAIYRAHGLDEELARRVAVQLTAADALGTHAREELGITETLRARPLQAAFASAGAFALGAALPIVVVLATPRPVVGVSVATATLVALALLGAAAARTGGASMLRGAIRVGFWGALAMALTALAGLWFGAAA
ncbi:MAG TPA: VIT1/CCC1 transporter family protein [Longimicrobium sp.]|nr:VIT1/CCC1 transporter family protein [Longimicrobium sp.]